MFKTAIKTAILRGCLLRWRQNWQPRKVAILGYHSVAAEPDDQSASIAAGITVEAENFRRQMGLLRKHFNPVTMNDIADWLEGNAVLPRRSVAITFDDGFADNFDLAAPIMEEFGLRGTFYLTVGSVMKQKLPWFCRLHYLFHRAGEEKLCLTDPDSGRRWNFGDARENRAAFVHYNYPCASLDEEEQDRYVQKLESWFGMALGTASVPKMMTMKQARQLCERGHFVGNHSFSHGNLAHIPADALRYEMAYAHEILERELGQPVRHFSYPHPCLHPQWNEATLALSKELGYRTAVLTQQGVADAPSPPLLLPRVMIGNPNEMDFLWKLETALADLMT